MKDLLAAERYARALFELSRASGQDQLIEDELQTISAVLKGSEEMKAVLESPRLRVVQKRALLEKLYPERTEPIYKTLLNFYGLLLDKGRFLLIHEIAVAFKKISDLAQRESTAEVKTAIPMTPEQERHILSGLERMTGHKVFLKKEVDARLVGGVFVRIGNKIMDGSIQNKIRSLKKDLLSIRTA